MYIDRRRIFSFVLSSFPLFIGIGISVLSSDAGILEKPSDIPIRFTLIEIMIQAVVITLLGVTAVLGLFWLLYKRSTRRFVIALIISPMLGIVSLFVGNTLLLIMFKNASNLLHSIVLIISLGISLMSIVFIVTDTLPSIFKSMFVAFYGSVFGTFVGVTMMTSTIVVLLIALIIEDYVLIRLSPAVPAEQMSDDWDSDPFEYTRIEVSHTVIGVGDYMAYALIGAHAIIFFPIHVWTLSIIMALLGMVINSFILLSEDRVLPAIPLPAALALFPWLVHILVLTL